MKISGYSPDNFASSDRALKFSFSHPASDMSEMPIIKFSTEAAN